jgi:hypothetical protein
MLYPPSEAMTKMVSPLKKGEDDDLRYAEASENFRHLQNSRLPQEKYVVKKKIILKVRTKGKKK